MDVARKNRREADLSRLGARGRLGDTSRVVGAAAHVGGAGDFSDNHLGGGCVDQTARARSDALVLSTELVSHVVGLVGWMR